MENLKFVVIYFKVVTFFINGYPLGGAFVCERGGCGADALPVRSRGAWENRGVVITAVRFEL